MTLICISIKIKRNVNTNDSDLLFMLPLLVLTNRDDCLMAEMST